MKKIILLLMVLIASCSYAQDVTRWQDSTATDTVRSVTVSGKTPMPVQKPLVNPIYDVVTVGATEVQVATSGFVIFRNDSGYTVYFGNSGVTTSDGFPLPTGSERSFVLDKNVKLYAIAGSSVDIRRLVDERP